MSEYNVTDFRQRAGWATRGKSAVTEQRQRIIVFIAGGATYSESRSCYEASKKWNRDVILGTTDMITPAMFIRELSRTREPRQNLNLAMDKVRSVPQPQQQYQPPAEQRTPPPREQSGRMGPPQSHPASMRPCIRSWI